MFVCMYTNVCVCECVRAFGNDSQIKKKELLS